MAVSSPCIRICILDEASGLCVGCGRTRDEIAAWGTMTEAHRIALMGDLPHRMSAAGLAEAAGLPEPTAPGRSLSSEGLG